ncbi:structural maintenance of chromosomes protein 6-like [Trichosurus vulpecula]|uniref:structural maintenance of chromosomes protein 6-like n=1 Tax=Trichosurus vulpecula TaxID=9337 RepID=UPI00186B4CFE|nr:structural maintenance of chromosomes protein 6-like [Trichosurus vulpecula]
MAQREGGAIPVVAEEPQRARPGPEGDSNEDKEAVLLQSVSHGGAASPLASGSAGIIESVQLENFMCHAKLGPVKFGPNVNFVVGRRGKSALLTALAIGLGGESLGSSLSEFVKDGELSANISITLRNTGEDAFKSDLYGDSITVQQCISVNGTTSYKLKDQAGNLVCSQKAELMAILDHFKIQVDNPASILPQEMGRQLLRTQHDSDRYKFFLKVTGLQQRREEYSEALERKARSQLEIDQKKEELENLKCQSIAVEEHVQKMVALREKLEDLKHEMAWALVTETEREVDGMVHNINLGDHHTTLLNQKLEASKAKLNASEKKYTTILENLQMLNKEAAELEPKCIEAKEDAKRTDKAYYQAEAFHTASQNELNQLDKFAEHFYNKMEVLKKSLELAELEKQENISTLKETLKNFKDQQDSLVRDIKHLHQAIEKDGEECSEIRKEESYVQQILHEEQQQLNQWKECKTEPLKRFGSQIPTLLEAVDDAHRRGHFIFKPIGPLGACIRFQDPEFALAIESCLNGLLLAFFCDNHKDEQILQELMKRFYPLGSPQPQIIVSAFECQLYDVTDRMAYHPEFPTVLTALEIDHPVVVNTLIDMRGIESVLLVKSNPLARRVMQAQEPPKNCSKVLTACGDEVFENRYYSCEESRPTYLGDLEIEIGNLEKEIENKTAQLLTFQQHESSLEKAVRKNQETINSHYQHLKEIKTRIINITSEIKDLEDEDKSQSIGLSVLQEEVQAIKEEMKDIEEGMKAQKEEMENLKQLKIDAEGRHEELKLRCNEVLEFIESFMEEQNQAALEVNVQHQSVLYYENKLKQHLNSLQVEKEELAMKERVLERETALAKSTCAERKEVTTTASALDEKITVLRKTIQSENYIYGSQDETRRYYQEIKESCLDLADKVKSLKKFIEALDVVTNQSYSIYQNHRKSLSLRCKLYFHSLLSQWSFSGEMHLDHENETLSITVQPGEGNTTAFSDTQAFSGGRHSFSNFLLILTLWSVTESPFRCLDALDGYMDVNHRKTAMDMILSIAHLQQHCQFILLTPQYMSSLPPSSLIEILKMPDPDETILPFQAKWSDVLPLALSADQGENDSDELMNR